MEKKIITKEKIYNEVFFLCCRIAKFFHISPAEVFNKYSYADYMLSLKYIDDYIKAERQEYEKITKSNNKN